MGYPEKLDVAIEKSGKSQSAIARETGIAQSTISAMTRGERRPYLDQAFKLAKALGVTVDYLIDDAQESPTSSEGETLSEGEQRVLWLFRSLAISAEEAARRLAGHVTFEGVEPTPEILERLEYEAGRGKEPPERKPERRRGAG